MTKSEILQLAVDSGLNPATFKRRGITDDVSDEFLVGEFEDMIAYYKEMEEKAQRVKEAVGDALARLSPSEDWAAVYGMDVGEEEYPQGATARGLGYE